MKVATKNFRPGMVLGEGGFDKVFKGWLDEKGTGKSGIGTPIVVKKLNSEGLQGFEEWQNGTKEDSLNTTINRTANATMLPVNETIALPLKQSRQVRTKLDKIEAGLQKARSAIKEAKNGSQLQDPEYVPIGLVYWDAKAFHMYLFGLIIIMLL